LTEARPSISKTWLAYAGAGFALTVLGAAAAALLLPGESERAVWVAAGIAYALQLVAFAVLLIGRGHGKLFMVGWLGGMLIRFAGVGGVAWWVMSTAALPAAAALISLAAFLFALLLLEPIFLRRGLRTT
jgi:hypothetical protein